LRHVRYSDPPTVGHINWGGLARTLLFIAAFALLMWWLLSLVAGEPALFDWLPVD
jgi:hypothetical protein